MATTTKQNNQFCTTAPSIDANRRPWDSISAYTTWLTDTIGMDTPMEGTEILVRNAATGELTAYRYEVISGSATWKMVDTEIEVDDALSTSSTNPVQNKVVKAAIAAIESSVAAATANASNATTAASTAATNSTTSATNASNAATSASNAATSAAAAAASAADAADALAAVQSAISGLDPSGDDAVDALAIQVAALDVTVNGGDTETFNDIKASGVLYAQRRIYGDGAGNGGYVLTGDSSVSIMVFAVSAGDVIRLTGLKSSASNPTLCWAVYDTYIIPDTDSDTQDAMAAAVIDYDPSADTGRTGVSATLTMPSGAEMLIISIPYSDDASTVEKKVITTSSGYSARMAAAEGAIEDLQDDVEVLPTISSNVTNLQSRATALENTTSLLQSCASVDVKALLSTTVSDYGVINGYGRITSDGKIGRDIGDVCTTYIIKLSAFADLKFSASGLASNPNNASLCWATYNIPEADVDFDNLFNSPYQLDWSNYLLTAYSDTSIETGRTGVSVDILDLTNAGATFLVFSTLTASASSCSIRNYDSTAISSLKEKSEKADSLYVLKNHTGRPATWDARTTITSHYSTATMTLGEDYAHITVTSSQATSGERGLWLGFYNRNLVAGHKYMMLVRYRMTVGDASYVVLSFYSPYTNWSNDGYLRICVEEDSDKVWKTDMGSQYFTAQSDGDLWIDFILKVSNTTTGASTDVEMDFLPMLIDITDTNLNEEALLALIDKAGVFYDSMVLAPYAINPLKGIVEEEMVTLGDSTTGMMLWQSKLAKIKGWNWDARQISGRTFDGVDSPYTAMGIGSTACEPIIYGSGASGAGYSQYIRARYVKYYEPTIILVMCSYNGAHNGAHWGDNSNYPTQPADYGLAALIASGMNTDTGTYNDTYMGEEVDLTADASASVPSFAASYFGMIYRLVIDNPAARIVLITLMNDFEPSNSEYLDLKNEVIEKAGEVFHLQVIDANRCGINRTNRLTTRYDEGGVHFNEAGGLLLAKYIASQV